MRKVEVVINSPCCVRIQCNIMILGIVHCFNWNRTTWNLYQYLEVKPGDCAISNNYLSTINLVDYIFGDILFHFNGGVIVLMNISIIGIKEPLIY